MVYCPRCHAPNDPLATQCHYCGLTAAQMQDVRARSAKTGRTFAIVWWVWCGFWAVFWLFAGFISIIGWLGVPFSVGMALLAFLWYRP